MSVGRSGGAWVALIAAFIAACTPGSQVPAPANLDGTYLRLAMGVIEEMIIPSAILAIEVYPGGVVPGEYLGFGSRCGVVAVWTGIRPN